MKAKSIILSITKLFAIEGKGGRFCCYKNTNQVLQWYEMVNSNLIWTPMEFGMKLSREDSSKTQENNTQV
jgi:hypothetical protein